jgi:hypothetical protein
MIAKVADHFDGNSTFVFQAGCLEHLTIRPLAYELF